MTRLILAALAIFILVGAVLAASGVLHVRNNNDESGVTIDKKELQEKTQDAVKKTQEAGSKILDETGKGFLKASEGLRGSGDKSTPAAKPQLNDKNLPNSDDSQQVPEKQGA